jgi:hypothetical protein
MIAIKNLSAVLSVLLVTVDIRHDHTEIFLNTHARTLSMPEPSARPERNHRERNPLR